MIKIGDELPLVVDDEHPPFRGDEVKEVRDSRDCKINDRTFDMEPMNELQLLFELETPELDLLLLDRG